MGGRGAGYKRTGMRVVPEPTREEESTREEKREEEEAKPEEERKYHYFYDKPSGGWEYKGDGHHQVQWFKENSNFDEIIRGADSDDISALHRWTEGHFMNGQQYRGWDNMSRYDQEYTQRYDDMLDKSVITKGVTVVRRTTAEWLFGKGHYSASLEELKSMAGKEITIKGNMSTGAAAQGLTIGDDSKHHEIRIRIPAGSKGAGMWIGDHRVNGWGPEQREFMTNRDIVVKVGRTTYDKTRGVYVTDVTYTRRMPHDYGETGRLDAAW